MTHIALTLPATTVTVSDMDATITASVTNRGSVPDRIVLGAFAADPRNPINATTWTTIDKPLREVAPGATEQYAITFAPPGTAAPGTYPVRFIAYSANSAPEESADQARQVDVLIPSGALPPPAKKKSRWPFAVMAALVLVVAAVAFAIWPKPPADPNTPSIPEPPPSVTTDLPDLVISDIILNQAADANDDVVMSVAVQNAGASTTQGFEVACECECKDFPGSPLYFSRGTLVSGLDAGQAATLGGDSLLNLSSCPFRPSRTFTCTVDAGNLVEESDEANNTMAKVLLTGR